MSEPLGVEERARLREWAEAQGPEHPLGSTVTALLDEVDRLTEALEAAERHRAEAVRDLLNARRAIADEWYPRAERAEADLAGENRRRAEVLRVLDETEWNDWPGRHRLIERLHRALLDTATEETQGAP